MLVDYLLANYGVLERQGMKSEADICRMECSVFIKAAMIWMNGSLAGRI